MKQYIFSFNIGQDCPPKQTFNYEETKSQQFPENTYIINSNQLKRCCLTANGKFYPLVLRIVSCILLIFKDTVIPPSMQPNVTSSSHIIYLDFIQTDNNYSLRYIKQKTIV